MNCNPIPERDDWFITDRKPTICPRCKKKEVRPSMFDMPTAETAHSGKWHIAGCNLICQFIELGAAVYVTLHFLKIPIEILLH